MIQFELRQANGGLALTGGQLKEQALKFVDAESAIRVVGFLSQRHGSMLRIFDAAGEVLETQRRDPVIPLPGAVGGLEGPS